MDYLDPRKRHSHNIRLVIGYCLVTIVIGLATIIVVYGANGYGINTKTGQIVQNGLLFTDSNPGGAKVFINGEDRNAATPSRLILTAGNYKLTLKKDGYRDWNRSFTLNEQSVARYVYPFLFPSNPTANTLKSYSSAPTLLTETPDRHWLLVQDPQNSGQVPTFDQYDTSTLDQSSPALKQVSLPAGLLNGYSSSSKLTEVEWSTDNDHLLLRHDSTTGYEFVVLSLSHPDESFNVNQLFNVNPTQVALFNKKADQLYIFDQADGSLKLGNTKNQNLSTVIAKSVLAFKPYSDSLITYVTDANEPLGRVAARIWQNGKTYKLSEFSSGSKYLIDAAQFQGDFYYAAGSNTSTRINIYENPLDGIKNPSLQKALPLVALNISNAQKLAFSDNTRFIEAENGQRFSVYDFETGTSYQYPLDKPLADNMVWMDGHRLIGQSDGKVFVMDYDGTNKQSLGATTQLTGALFSRDYKHMLTTSVASNGTSIALQDIDMRAGVDLPKK